MSTLRPEARTTEHIDRLRAWILEKNPDLTDVPLDVDIIGSRLLSSLQFVEFLLLVEELRGAPISADEVDIESFGTLQLIHDNFLTG